MIIAGSSLMITVMWGLILTMVTTKTDFFLHWRLRSSVCTRVTLKNQRAAEGFIFYSGVRLPSFP
ncbi:Uncharacterised protein [uncultured Ruminococcus sp.]|nr:Uncharacterised protein [uncultured Ruminococcus sp.]